MAIKLPRYERQVEASGRPQLLAIDSGVSENLVTAAGAKDRATAFLAEGLGKFADEVLKDKAELEARGRQVELDNKIAQWNTEVETDINNALTENNSLTFEEAQNNVLKKKEVELDKWVSENMDRVFRSEVPALQAKINQAKNGANGTIASAISQRQVDDAVYQITLNAYETDAKMFQFERDVLPNLATQYNEETKRLEAFMEDEEGNLVPSPEGNALLDEYYKVQAERDADIARLTKAKGAAETQKILSKGRMSRYDAELETITDRYYMGVIPTFEEYEEQVNFVLDSVEKDPILDSVQKAIVKEQTLAGRRDVYIKAVKQAKRVIDSALGGETPTLNEVINEDMVGMAAFINEAKQSLETRRSTGLYSAVETHRILEEFQAGEIDIKSLSVQLTNSGVDIDDYVIAMSIATSELSSNLEDDPGQTFLRYWFPGGKKMKRVGVSRLPDTPAGKQILLMGRQVQSLIVVGDKDSMDRVNTFLTKAHDKLKKVLKMPEVTDDEGNVNEEKLNELMDEFYESEDGVYSLAAAYYNR